MLAYAKELEFEKAATIRDEIARVKGGMIDGAVNIPLDELRDNLDKLDRTKTIYVYCRSGQRSYIGMRILKGYGIDSDSLSGGYLLYEAIMDERSGS